MTKKERAKLELLTVALLAHAEAARERGMDAEKYNVELAIVRQLAGVA